MEPISDAQALARRGEPRVEAQGETRVETRVETQGAALADLIRREIIAGAFAPGAKLKVRELSDRYGVGATPVREALSRLVPSALIVAEDHKGFRVARLDGDELKKLTWTRVQAESIALKASIAGGSVAWEGALLAAHHQLTRTPRPANQAHPGYRLWEQAHEAFHAALLSGCDSPWLLDFIASLSDQCTRYRRLSGARARRRPGGNARNVEDEHKALLDAALARNARAACQLLEAHYWATANLVLEREPLAS